MQKNRKTTSDAVAILHRRYYEGKPGWIAELEEARAEDELARKIYELREEATLTHARLAKMVGTTASVISRLEDSDNEARPSNSSSDIRFVFSAVAARTSTPRKRNCWVIAAGICTSM